MSYLTKLSVFKLI